MNKSFYEEGYEYPTDVNIARDPVFVELRDHCQDVIDNPDTTPRHKSQAWKVIALIDYGEAVFFDLEIESEAAKHAWDLYEESRGRYGY